MIDGKEFQIKTVDDSGSEPSIISIERTGTTIDRIIINLPSADIYAAHEPTANNQQSGLRHISEYLVCPLPKPEPEKCFECGFPADVHLINWYCSTCYAGLNEEHRED